MCALICSAPAANADAEGELLVLTCMALDESPNMTGVVGVLDSLMDNGLSAYQAALVLGKAGKQVCPEYQALIRRFAIAVA